ncbi:MAG: ATPase [Lachnospiraceae bacterium]|nr:ATPase [Lachnospiraceae bacterium]
MVEKMRFVSVIGPKDDIDRVTEEYISKYEIHLENTLTELSSLDNIHPFLESNPYSQLQKNINQLKDYIKEVDDDTKLKDMTATEASATIIKAYEEYDNFNKKVESLRQKKREINEHKNLVAPFINLDFELSDILKYKFIRFRFGKMTHDHYSQFMKYEYDKLNVIFMESNIDEEYVWGIYFTPIFYRDKVDAIFSSLHFERIIIPEDYEGTAKNSYDKYEEELKSIDLEIESKRLETLDYFEKNKINIASAIKVVDCYSKNQDVRKMAACTIDTSRVFQNEGHNTYYIICGWLSDRDAVLFHAELDKDPNVFCLVEEADNLHIKPPTKLKNFALFKPFQMYVEMYGLPTYNESDPTAFLAITYSILFGLMFGDVGQGLILMIAGFLLYMTKKINLAGILGLCGVFSTIFGFVYGSIFGFEDKIKPLWVSPMHNVMTVLLATVAFGIVLNLCAMVLNMINGIKHKDIETIFFDTNGVAGFVFYIMVVFCVFKVLLGEPLPATWVLGLCLGIPLIVIYVKEPLANIINKKEHIIEGSVGMYFVESFFELFEVLLSFLTNTLSFVRVGAFALSHAGLMSVVLMLAGAESGEPNMLVIVLGNAFVMGLEGLTVSIQVLRLQYYEMFSRYYDGGGKPFKSFIARN